MDGYLTDLPAGMFNLKPTMGGYANRWLSLSSQVVTISTSGSLLPAREVEDAQGYLCLGDPLQELASEPTASRLTAISAICTGVGAVLVQLTPCWTSLSLRGVFRLPAVPFSLALGRSNIRGAVRSRFGRFNFVFGVSSSHRAGRIRWRWFRGADDMEHQPPHPS